MRNFIFLLIFLNGCSLNREQSVQFRDFEKDFPITETLVAEELSHFEPYGQCNGVLVKDSIIFMNERTAENFGRCLNIYTGREINKLVIKGNANNEMLHVDKYELLGDSLQAISGNHPQKLKLYSINDIVQCNPSNPREIYMPDTLQSFSYTLIDQNTIFGMSSKRDDLNDAKYFLFNNQELKNVGKLRKELVEANIEPDYNDMRFGGILCKKQNDKLVVASRCALQFEIIDLKTLEIEKSCYYDKLVMEIQKDERSTMHSSNSKYYINSLGCNDDYIYALCAKNIVDNEFEFLILKFDWNFKPIARYNIAEKIKNSCFVENCKYFYALNSDSSGEYETIKRYKL